jgi:uncharacterized protein involved in exopolysaccharide biosynthesis
MGKEMRRMPNWQAVMKRPFMLGIIVGLVSLALSLFIPNRYRSSVRLLPVESRAPSGLGGLASAAAAFGVSVQTGDNPDANFVDILQSRTIMEPLLNTRFHFIQNSRLLRRPEQKDESLFDYLDVANLDRAVKEVGRVVSVNRDPKTKILTIEVETRSAELSQRVAQVCVALLENYLKDRNQTRGGYKSTFTEARLVDAKQDLSKAEEALREFLDKNRNYQTSLDPAIRIRGLHLEMELRLRQQLVSTLSVSYEQALIDKTNDMPILNILDPGNLPLEKSGPARGKTAVTLAIMAALGVFLFEQRSWISNRILKGL